MRKASFAGGVPRKGRVFFSRTHDAPLEWRAPSRRPTLIAVLVAFAAMICGMPAHAINIDVEQVTVPKPLPPIPFVKPKPLPPPPVPRIRLTGMIETGDAGKLEAVLTKVANAVIAAACQYHRAPAAIYAGRSPTCRVIGIPLPERLKPAPLNFIVRGMKPGDIDEASFVLDGYEFLDFDAF